MVDTRKSLEDSRVLITGGAGFVGANLARYCLRAGADVHIVTRPTASAFRLKDIAEDVTIHWVDLTDLGSLKRIFNEVRPEVIFNAVRLGTHSASSGKQAFFQGNVLTAHHLLEASDDVGYLRLVHFGSSTEYGPKERPMAESDLPEPSTYYGATKAAASLLFQAAARESGRPIVILRAFNLFGPWDAHTRLIPTVILAALTGKPVSLTKPGFRRDYVYIGDFLHCCLKAVCVDDAVGEIINVASGVETSNEEVVAKIQEQTGKKITIHRDEHPGRTWDTGTWGGDNSKARRLLGPCCETDLDEGLKKTVQWFEENMHYYECR